MNLQAKAAFKVATRYGARKEEKKVFAACWKWRTKVDKLYKDQHKDIERELERQVGLVASVCKGRMVKPELGHRYVYRGRTEQKKYVIFSDHHWATSAHRQNFFAISGNRELYCDLLEEYYERGYILVENGDVEELIIFEPTLAEVERRAAMSEADLRKYRLVERRKLLERILNDPRNARLYRVLRKFHKANKFIRIVGNHDYDLQRPSLLEVFRQKFPGIPVPYDYALLTTGDKVDYCIIHGHQFDAATNPVYAPKGGETISESMSWAYQGPDRNWRWTGHGENWATGKKAFNNVLVDDDFAKHRGGLFDKLSLVFGTLHSTDAWEALFKHNIAWEYFTNSDPQKAVNKEVKKGKQWFKFRHMDELFLRRQLNKHFNENNRPRMVLGHTHEVRIFPAYPSSGGMAASPYGWIFNTGAAGRFENLIWGLEIVDSRPRLVSWSRPCPKEGKAERRVYKREDKSPFKLWASKTPVPLTLESFTIRSGTSHRVSVDFHSHELTVGPPPPI